VRRYTLEKPKGFSFEPGQATEVSIDKEGWRDRKSPFTFTALAEWDHLEFTIKSYFDHEGITNELWSLKPGDRLLLRDVWGTITYKGPGTFIAGGAGVTPFIAILRRLHADHQLEGHRLIVSNRTAADIILRDEFEAMEGLRCLFTVTDEPDPTLEHRRIDRKFLEDNVTDFDQHFYVCGPKQMVADLKDHLEALGAQADAVVFEQ
jgi:ferredoxin-NADP reductase